MLISISDVATAFGLLELDLRLEMRETVIYTRKTSSNFMGTFMAKKSAVNRLELSPGIIQLYGERDPRKPLKIGEITLLKRNQEKL